MVAAHKNGRGTVAAKLPVVRHYRDLRATVQRWRGSGKTVALVPTMGALHDGHLSLVKLARKHAKRVVVSLFVNPTQFGPKEDFAAYPRDEQGDWQKLAAANADLLYAPLAEDMYGEDFSTRVEVIGLTSGLEGAARPHHFAGVTTVVTKLFLQCLPDFALFGEKDYQQLLVIRQLVSDLNFPITIVPGPTLRAPDGLALSSRNAYLTPDERKLAPHFHAVLREIAAQITAGRPVREALFLGRDRLEGAGFRVDYLDVRDAGTFLPIERPLTSPARALGAVVLGRVRLIDNVPIIAERSG
jgi:pantoate--beta-alanine ligase